MRDTLSMLLTWVDRDFRLSVLVLVLILFVRFWPWPQQWQEKAALNSSRNFPGDEEWHEIHLETIRFEPFTKPAVSYALWTTLLLEIHIFNKTEEIELNPDQL